MPVSVEHWLPDDAALQQGLNTLLNRGDATPEPVTVVSRRENVYTSTFGSEIVVCRQGETEPVELLMKYGRPGVKHGDKHRGGVDLEAIVYQQILNPLQVPTVTCFGTYVDEASGYHWLVLAYLGQAQRLNRSPKEALLWSARWLGGFHAHLQARLQAQSFPQLARHSPGYYIGWARRTQLYTQQLRDTYPWLPVLCQRFEAHVPLFANRSPTIIHGEFYPMNILIEDETVYPVDWQSAAIASGEIDLASLIEGWGFGDLVQQSIEAYGQARWGDAVPANYRQMLALAQVHWPLRWLGETPEQTLEPRFHDHFEYLREAGERAGLI